MQMFIENSDHYEFLSDCIAAKPSRIFISTYGIYAGITYNGQDTIEWGPKYRLITRDILESMRRLPNVKMLIGAALYKSCKDKLQCIDCERQYVKQLIRYIGHAELFPEFEWRITTELHLKCTIFHYDDGVRGVAGGRNFTNSEWADLTFELTKSQIQGVYKHCMELWGKSAELTESAIAAIFESQEISQRGFHSVLDGIA